MAGRRACAGRDVVENGSAGPSVPHAVGFGPRRPVDERDRSATSTCEQNNVPDYGLPWAAVSTAQRRVLSRRRCRAPATDVQLLRAAGQTTTSRTITTDIATVRLEQRSRSDSGVTLAQRHRATANYDRDSVDPHAPRPPQSALQRRSWTSETLPEPHDPPSPRMSQRATLRAAASRPVLRVQAHEDTRGTSATSRAIAPTSRPDRRCRTPVPPETPLRPMPAITGNPSRRGRSTIGADSLRDRVVGRISWQVSGGRWRSLAVGLQRRRHDGRHHRTRPRRSTW